METPEAVPPEERETWNLLDKSAPGSVCKRAKSGYDEKSRMYTLRSLGQPVEVFPGRRVMRSPTPLGKCILEEYGSYSRLAIVHYLVNAKDILPSGRLVLPQELPGGDIFRRGTHRLPLDRLAGIYGTDLCRFAGTCSLLGGAPADIGDAAFQLKPLPEIPIYAVLWEGCHEFPPSASLLFDSVCQLHLATDILWGLAMLTAEILINYNDSDVPGSF